jgi:predicted transcriptional regulator
MGDETSQVDHIELAAGIVSAFVSNNSVPAGELPALIQSVFASLGKIAASGKAEPAEPKMPAVPIKRSVTHDYIICLEDGKKFKSLKRHLRTAYGMSPEEYRAKWGLSRDYPMVAPAYAAARSALATQMQQGGAGQGGGRRPCQERAWPDQGRGLRSAAIRPGHCRTGVREGDDF